MFSLKKSREKSQLLFWICSYSVPQAVYTNNYSQRVSWDIWESQTRRSLLLNYLNGHPVPWWVLWKQTAVVRNIVLFSRTFLCNVVEVFLDQTIRLKARRNVCYEYSVGIKTHAVGTCCYHITTYWSLSLKVYPC